MREELAAAQSCLPSIEALTKFLDNALPTSEATDLDNVEAGMELQDALVGVRDALASAQGLLPVAVSTPPAEPPRTKCAMCGGNRDTCGHFVGHGAM